tara:strand:- start:3194 stop:3691 length:498 start_codon:yes stop_codon:yes gene_type:complete
MIISCKSCEKKFVVPDQAITIAGRVVQCGSCGNKWKQFPMKTEKKSSTKIVNTPKPLKDIIETKPRKRKTKKKREINLYSPEYLAKKHGIKLNEIKIEQVSKKTISFGFYNSLVLFLVIIIAFSRILFFTQDFIIQKFPFTEFYLEYFFESIKNLFEIWKNLITG